MTVSHVLNDRAGKVGEQTRERVMRVIDELHYSPSAVARGLSRRRMDAIGVVFYTRTPSRLVGSSYQGEILGGIIEAATAREQSTTLFTEVGFTGNHKRLNVYCDGRCDGLIFVAPRSRDELIHAMRHTDVPYVIIGDSSPDAAWSSVDIDNVEAAMTATNYLVSLGHSRIAVLLGNEQVRSSQLREHGFRRAMGDAGLHVDESLIMHGLYSEESGYDRVIGLLSNAGDLPTALFCFSDEIAFGALRACRQRGVNVPEQLSIIGFDDIQSSANTHPALTTMRQPLNFIGSQAITMVLEQIRGDAPPGRAEVLRAELIQRDSVAPMQR